jgi:hypothetical protein
MKVKEVIAEEIRKHVITENLQYHLDLGLSLTESVFRVGSKAHDELMQEVRKLYKNNILHLTDKDDLFIMENTDAGKIAVFFDENKLNEGEKKGVYDGEKVTLDNPSRVSDSDKKFRVYVDSGKKTADGETKAKKVEWGSPDYEIKNDDPEASKSFRARHKCSEKSDRTKAGWWACNVHKYHKQLGLSSSKPW